MEFRDRLLHRMSQEVARLGTARPPQPGPVVLMSPVKHRTHDWDVLHARQREVD